MCSSAFRTLGRAQLDALGGTDMPIAIIAHPFGTLSRAGVRALAEQCVADIAAAALGRTSPRVDEPIARAAEVARATQVDMPFDAIAFNDACERLRWGDGLPLIAPTPERVEAMLRAVPRAPASLIARVPPAFGAASVERIAINAVMAGLKPALLAALIAAVDAACDPRFNLQAIQATTNAAAPWIVVGGPIVRAQGFNAAWNCLGPGAASNATLGRALRLVLQNIGGARGGEMDRATHGQPGKYTFCCAENEAQSPWPSLHVERGFAAGASALTVVGAAGTLNLNSHAKDAGDLLRVLADSMIFPTSNDYHFAGEPWLVLSPEHAAIFAQSGWSKDDVKARLWDATKMSAGRFAAKDFDRVRHTRGAELGSVDADTPVPISPGAVDIGIVVAGGAGTHSVYVPTFGQTRAVSRRID